MEAFLFWIGLYNAAAPVVLLALQHERTADFVLRQLTEIVAVPYRHGPFGRLWLWWATVTNTALGALMLAASSGSVYQQQVTCWVVLGVYAAMYLVLLVGARGPRYGRGVAVVHGLWLGQIGWAIWALATAN